jgi:hypothetical protein
MGLPKNVNGSLVQTFMSPSRQPRALRGAIFLMDYGDVARVKWILQCKGNNKSHVLAF